MNELVALLLWVVRVASFAIFYVCIYKLKDTMLTMRLLALGSTGPAVGGPDLEIFPMRKFICFVYSFLCFCFSSSSSQFVIFCLCFPTHTHTHLQGRTSQGRGGAHTSTIADYGARFKVKV